VTRIALLDRKRDVVLLSDLHSARHRVSSTMENRERWLEWRRLRLTMSLERTSVQTW
jgi:hypothetical protein